MAPYPSRSWHTIVLRSVTVGFKQGNDPTRTSVIAAEESPKLAPVMVISPPAVVTLVAENTAGPIRKVSFSIKQKESDV